MNDAKLGSGIVERQVAPDEPAADEPVAEDPSGDPTWESPTAGQLDTTPLELDEYSAGDMTPDEGDAGAGDGEPDTESIDDEIPEEFPPDNPVTRTATIDETITDFSAESLAAYEASGAAAVAVYEDGSEAVVPWSEVSDPSPQPHEAIDEWGRVARATGQHFWSRAEDEASDGAGTGAFVTDEERDEFLEAAAGGFADAGGTRPWHNVLVNSLGILLRSGLRNLVSITRSAVAFFDGEGNDEANVTAQFGRDGARVGRRSGTHVDITTTAIKMMRGAVTCFKMTLESVVPKVVIGWAGGCHTELNASSIAMKQGSKELVLVGSSGTSTGVRIGAVAAHPKFTREFRLNDNEYNPVFSAYTPDPSSEGIADLYLNYSIDDFSDAAQIKVEDVTAEYESECLIQVSKYTLLDAAGNTIVSVLRGWSEDSKRPVELSPGFYVDDNEYMPGLSYAWFDGDGIEISQDYIGWYGDFPALLKAMSAASEGDGFYLEVDSSLKLSFNKKPIVPIYLNGSHLQAVAYEDDEPLYALRITNTGTVQRRYYEDGAWGDWTSTSMNITASRAANCVYAAPNGSNGTASWRKLVAADVPSLNASKITAGTLPVERGGTGTSAFGSVTSKDISDAVAVASGLTGASIGAITLAAGTWMVVYGAQFASNATGWREVTISASTDSYASRTGGARAAAASGTHTIVRCSQVLIPTSQTVYHLNCRQTSGSALNCTGYIRAVRLK